MPTTKSFVSTGWAMPPYIVPGWAQTHPKPQPLAIRRPGLTASLMPEMLRTLTSIDQILWRKFIEYRLEVDKYRA